MFEKIQKYIITVFNQKYARAGLYYIIANILGQGVVLFSSGFFTRMMSKSDYGLASTYSTWALVLNSFICLNLFISVRTAYIDFNDEYDEYNSSVLLLCILFGVLVSIFLMVGLAIWNLNCGINEVLLVCVQSISLNIINFMMAIQSMKNEYIQRTFLMIAPNWTHILLSVVLMLLFTKNLYISKITGNSLGLFIYSMLCVIQIIKKSRPKIIMRYWKYALKISMPSIFHTLSDLILMQCDRLMLTSMVGSEETAEYSVIYNVSSIIVAVYQAINGAWTPWFFNKMKNGDEDKIKRYQGYYLLLFTFFTCGVMTISPEIVMIISPRNYWNGIRYVAPIVVASYLIFVYAFFSAYLLYMKRTSRIAINTIVAALINLCLNYLLIPRFKAIGAVVATVISYVILFFLYYQSINVECRESFDTKKIWSTILFVSLYGVLFYYIRWDWLLRYSVFAVLVVIGYKLYVKKALTEVIGDIVQ